MAGKLLSTVDGTYRNIKNGLATVNGVYRNLAKAYTTIGGVYRPCWSGGGEKLSYYGTITALSAARYYLAAATIGNYALFAGGTGPYGSSGVLSQRDVVDAYDASLTRSTPTALSTSKTFHSATTLGDYALFGGSASSAKVDAYDKSLTRSNPSNLWSRRYYGATTVGDYALFGGGSNSSGTTSKVVNAYDKSLTKSTPTAFSVARDKLAVTTVGDYALFGGGSSTSAISLEVYDKSLTRSNPVELSKLRCYMSATTVGGYAIFAGGVGVSTPSDTTSGISKVVDAFDESLTRSVPTTLDIARCFMAATTIGDYALFAGGGDSTTSNSTSTVRNVVDVYDKSLTKTTATTLKKARSFLAATTIGDYALFAGGVNASQTALDTVDAYTLV